MGWPKGKPRKGYVKKDGQPHAKHGERIAVVRKDPEVYTQTKKDNDTNRIEKTLHGASARPIIEVCPNCKYAYADGGYCPECGWTQYRPDCPHCTKGVK